MNLRNQDLKRREEIFIFLEGKNGCLSGGSLFDYKGRKMEEENRSLLRFIKQRYCDHLTMLQDSLFYFTWPLKNSSMVPNAVSECILSPFSRDSLIAAEARFRILIS